MDRLAADSGPRESGSGSGPAGWRESTQSNNPQQQQQQHQRNSPSSGSSSSAQATPYHDGLIPTDQTAFRNSVNFPEVVPSEVAVPSGRNSPAIVEKTYPEVNPTPSIHQEKNYPEVASPTSHSHHNSHHPHRHSNASHPRPTPSPAPTSLSNVHSIHHQGHGHVGAQATRTSLQAWSEAGEDEYHRNAPSDDEDLKAKAKRLYKQPIVWVVVGAIVIIAVLAGILGAIATGKIRTSATKLPPPQQTSAPTVGSGITITVSTAASGQVIRLSCPSAQNVNFTATETPGNKVFRRQCGINFPGGDGSLGRLNTTEITSLQDCLERCAAEPKCVAGVWLGRADPSPQCWLKEFIGVGSTSGNMNGVEAGVLWQQP